MKLPYGDQGLFCRREIFEKARGFGKPYLMEDVDFVKRCRRLGEIAFLPQTVVTSPRRYLEKGVLKAALQNHLTMALYFLGVDNADLARLYYGRTS
jgi:hypothetical protein